MSENLQSMCERLEKSPHVLAFLGGEIPKESDSVREMRSALEHIFCYNLKIGEKLSLVPWGQVLPDDQSERLDRELVEPDDSC